MGKFTERQIELEAVGVLAGLAVVIARSTGTRWGEAFLDLSDPYFKLPDGLREVARRRLADTALSWAVLDAILAWRDAPPAAGEPLSDYVVRVVAGTSEVDMALRARRLRILKLVDG